MKRQHIFSLSSVVSAGFALFIAALFSSVSLSAAEDARLYREAADRAAIEQLAYRYIHALDTRDADLYVSVFTEDAVYDIEGQIVEGHDALRDIITGLQASRDRAIAEGRTPVD